MERKFKMRFHAVFTDVLRTKFMQAADMFDKHKVIGKSDIFTIEGGTGESFTDMETSIRRLLQNTETIGEFLFLHVDKVIFEDGEIYYNTAVPPFFKENIRSISNGQKWCMFSDLIRSMTDDRFVIETTENMVVTGIKVKTSSST